MLTVTRLLLVVLAQLTCGRFAITYEHDPLHPPPSRQPHHDPASLCAGAGAAAGGHGGSPGAVGGTGTSGSWSGGAEGGLPGANGSNGSAGAQGNYINGNSYVTWESTGTRTGSIV